MNVHRFVAAEIGEGEALLPADEAEHALKVLRLKAGDAVCVSDGAGRQWRARIVRAVGEAVRVELLEALDACESPARITLYQGLPKADKLELIAQKAAELGANRLVPVLMARSVVRYADPEASRKRERLMRIALEAVKQCGRASIPRIERVCDFDEALDDMRERALLIIPWEEARGARMSHVFSSHPDARDIGIVVGPEGGIEPAEVERLRAVGGRAVTLGPRILRCETAAIASVAMAQQLWGDI